MHDCLCLAYKERERERDDEGRTSDCPGALGIPSALGTAAAWQATDNKHQCKFQAFT
jgi:hypothetical protein